MTVEVRRSTGSRTWHFTCPRCGTTAGKFKSERQAYTVGGIHWRTCGARRGGKS